MYKELKGMMEQTANKTQEHIKVETRKLHTDIAGLKNLAMK